MFRALARFKHRHASIAKLASVVVAAVAAIVAATGSASLAHAEDGMLDSVLDTFKLKPKLSPPADFVRDSRPPDSQLNYMAVGTRHADRPIKIKSAAELKAMETDLDAAGAAHAKLAPPAPVAPAPAPAKPKKPKAAAAKSGTATTN